ncbi:gamma-glutamylcyclotransferase family protein [Lentibacter sp. XHP0401]|uniref:gamma-glutamylcyclotransferase family protein n=1 Tax=Lentibacter sp. XHP0401 TaxID=2984334 RepID=UPI0021E8E47C|nr:gamma-glutamylcyclotransferase family protein [Lentibacter sp. XHP0401]MCV2894966.1 gamma-glutamylcyclotransferase [Lentibacter sp. XHP0401]
MHYFAYGTLLVEENMRKVAPGARNVGYMRLEDYVLGFGKCSQPGVAGCMLVPKKGGVTYGIQYELSDGSMAALDAAAHVAEEQWVHVPVTLTDEAGNKVQSTTYTIPGSRRPWAPTDTYVAPILLGLTQCDFPEEYKHGLRAMIAHEQAAAEAT